jgi:two-component system, response regulator
MPDTIRTNEILLIEDNATDAELCIRALTKHNLANNLVWVKDGAEALDYLFAEGAYAGRSLSNKPRVILLDLRMPKIDGIDVLRKVKADDRTKCIPVIVLTSSTQETELAECYRLGANGFTSKPVEFNSFADVVAKIGMYWLLINRPPP